MNKLIAGYKKFRSEVYPSQKEHFAGLSNRQAPHTLFITCSDSRIDPGLFLQTEPGDLFICRVVGNLIPAHGSAMGGVSSAIEYAVMVLGVKNIIVCGHSDCGAMRAFLHPEKLKSLKAVEAWLMHAEGAITMARENHPGPEDETFVNHLIHDNVLIQIQHLKTHPSVASRLRSGKLRVYGWYYDIPTGCITSYDDSSGQFVLLEEVNEEAPDDQLAHTRA